MKIKSTTSRISGKSTVEICAILAFAYFGISYGIDKVKEFQGERLTDAKLRDIAERVVFVAESAEMAGVDLVVDGNITKTVERVAQGGMAEYGAFKGQFYGVPELRDQARTRDKVARHLELQYDRLSVKKFESFASAD